MILECAARLLAGEAIRSLCRDLDEREVPTVSGGPWKLLDPHASLAGLVLVLRVLLQGQDVKVGSHEPS